MIAGTMRAFGTLIAGAVLALASATDTLQAQVKIDMPPSPPATTTTAPAASNTASTSYQTHQASRASSDVGAIALARYSGGRYMPYVTSGGWWGGGRGWGSRWRSNWWGRGWGPGWGPGWGRGFYGAAWCGPRWGWGSTRYGGGRSYGLPHGSAYVTYRPYRTSRIGFGNYRPYRTSRVSYGRPLGPRWGVGWGRPWGRGLGWGWYGRRLGYWFP